MLKTLTDKQRVRNFIASNTRPFTFNDVVSATGISENTVRNYLRQLVLEGTIKVSIRQRNINFYIKVKKNVKPELKSKGDFAPKPAKLKKIFNELSKCSKVKELAARLSYSKETIYHYLRVLVNEGCVVKSKARYYPKKFKTTFKSYKSYPKVTGKDILRLES